MLDFKEHKLLGKENQGWEMWTSRRRQKVDAWLMSCARTPSDTNSFSMEPSRNASSFCLEIYQI
jgi:hypothetical protein